jgi:hypothetical protein
MAAHVEAVPGWRRRWWLDGRRFLELLTVAEWGGGLKMELVVLKEFWNGGSGVGTVVVAVVKGSRRWRCTRQTKFFHVIQAKRRVSNLLCHVSRSVIRGTAINNGS